MLRQCSCVDVAAAEFRFSAVEFVETLLFDEANKKVSITRSHFSAHSDSVNLLVIVIRERKAVKRANEFSEANKRFGAKLLVSALVKKIFQCQESFVVRDNCIKRGYVHSKNEFVLAWKIEIAKIFERMISVFDI